MGARLEASFMTGGLAIRAIALFVLLLVMATWQPIFVLDRHRGLSIGTAHIWMALHALMAVRVIRTASSAWSAVLCLLGVALCLLGPLLDPAIGGRVFTADGRWLPLRSGSTLFLGCSYLLAMVLAYRQPFAERRPGVVWRHWLLRCWAVPPMIAAAWGLTQVMTWTWANGMAGFGLLLVLIGFGIALLWAPQRKHCVLISLVLGIYVHWVGLLRISYVSGGSVFPRPEAIALLVWAVLGWLVYRLCVRGQPPYVPTRVRASAS